MSRHYWSIVVMVMRSSSMDDLSMSRHYWSRVAMGERVMLSMGRHLIMVMTIIDHMGRCRLTRVTSFRAMASIPVVVQIVGILHQLNITSKQVGGIARLRSSIR